MSIINVLDEFESWLWHHYPDALSSYSPGLTDEEIDAGFEKLSLIPSVEIRELYKWYNGTDNLFESPYYHFDCGIPLFSIDSAIKFSIDFDWIAEKINIKSFCPFPEFECALHILACDGGETSPVLAIDEDFSPRIAWTSISSMISSHLEAYDQGIITLEKYQSQDKDRFLVRRTNDFQDRFKAICNSHNSESDYSNIVRKYNLRQ
jgi:hypothetical protein